jgi:hypothetical protein
VALTEAAERCGVRVLLKVRVASAVPIDNSGLSDEQFVGSAGAEGDDRVALVVGQLLADLGEARDQRVLPRIGRDRRG